MTGPAKGVQLDWDGDVEGLGDARGMPLWGTRLGDAARLAFKLARLSDAPWSPGDEAVVVSGGTAISVAGVRAALYAGREAGGDRVFRLGGRSGAFLEEVRLSDTRAGLWYLAPGHQGGLDERLAGAEPAELDPEERDFELPLPGSPLDLAITDRLWVPVRHWTELLWANLLGLGPYLWETLVGTRPLEIALRLAGAAIRAFSARPERIASSLNRLADGAKIHPSATVEGSVLGAGARVGAGAVVRGSVLGPGAVVEELAFCEGAVMGAEAVLQRQALFKYGTLGPGAALGGVTQLSVLGAGAALKRGAYGMDQALEGDVRVQVAGALKRPPLGLAGICLGAGTTVGSGVWIAPGRALAPGLAVVAPVALTNPSAPEGADGPLVVRGGRLEPL